MKINNKFKFLSLITTSIVLFINATPTVKIEKGSIAYHQLASSGGITGYSVAGCNCHGGTASSAVVTNISGLPTTDPIAGTTYALTLNINGSNPAAGFNLSTNNGTLTVANGETQVIGTELTHTSPKTLVSNTTSFSFNWTPATSGPAALNFAVNNIDATGGTGNDNWNVGVANTNVQTLPVTLLSFKAKYENETNIINWEVENEINFKKYELETSCNGTDFNLATSIVSSNSSAKKSYSYTDKLTNCNTAKVFYRLKLIELDNSFTYSKIIITNNDLKKQSFKLINNNIESNIDRVQLFSKQKLVNYSILNQTGKMIQKGNVSNNFIFFNTKLLPGIYYVNATFYNGDTHTEKFIVN